jgi:hypothetical protein
MRRTTKNKTIAATAFLLFLMLIAFLVPHFLGNSVDACGRHKPPHHHPRPPPLSKTIIKHFVYPDGTSIGAGLKVELWDDGNEPIATAYTDVDGKVVFEHLVDGTFTAEYDWQGIQYNETLRINCSKITWEFTNTVPYWTLEKTFFYEDTEVPVSHLTVYLNGTEGITNDAGTVVFTDLKAGHYIVEWVWGSETKTEEFDIGFNTASPVVLTNYVELKSGGGK